MLGTYTGVDETLEVGHDYVALVSSGMLSFLSSQPTRKVSYGSIRGAALSPCGASAPGSLRLSLVSAVEGLGVLFAPPPSEDLVFLFNKELGGSAGVDGANAKMAGVKRFIDDRATRPTQAPAPVAAGGAAPSIATELERLVHLRDRGELTRDEFEIAKRKLLGK